MEPWGRCDHGLLQSALQRRVKAGEMTTFKSRNQIQSQDDKFMRLTLQLAERGLVAGELPIGAILIMNSDVMAEAYCSDKRQCMLAHPELQVLVKADMKHPEIQERRQMTLYTNLEPCVMCLGAAMSFCLGRIVYGINAPADGAATRLSQVSFGNATYPEYKMPTIIGGVLKDESRALFEAFVEKSRDGVLVNFARGVLRADSDNRNTIDSFSRHSEP
jgi:tRNA(adenine34) deaminase